MATTSYTTLTAAQAAAAEWFTTAPEWVRSVQATIAFPGKVTTLAVEIHRDGTTRQA